jgi:hypothetical protein
VATLVLLFLRHQKSSAKPQRRKEEIINHKEHEEHEEFFDRIRRIDKKRFKTDGQK